MFHPTTRVQEPLLPFHDDHTPFGRDWAILVRISQFLKKKFLLTLLSIFP